LTLDRVEVTLVCICGQGLPTHEIRWKSEKLFVDVRTDVRTDTPEFQSTRSSPRRWPKNWVTRCWHSYLSGVRCKWFPSGPADATANRSSFASLKSRVVQPFWRQLTQAVLGKRPLNRCLSVTCLHSYGRATSCCKLSQTFTTQVECKNEFQSLTFWPDQLRDQYRHRIRVMILN